MSRRTTPKPLTKNQYRQLFLDTRTFFEAGQMIHQQPPPVPAGHDSYGAHLFSHRTISHFLFGMSIELRLKSFLRLRKVPLPNRMRRHELVSLYKALPSDITKELERIFAQIIKSEELRLIAFTYSSTPPDVPQKEFKVGSFHDFCEVCDNFFKLAQKRYSWENISPGKYEYFFDNLEPLKRFLVESEVFQQRVSGDAKFASD